MHPRRHDPTGHGWGHPADARSDESPDESPEREGGGHGGHDGGGPSVRSSHSHVAVPPRGFVPGTPENADESIARMIARATGSTAAAFNTIYPTEERPSEQRRTNRVGKPAGAPVAFGRRPSPPPGDRARKGGGGGGGLDAASTAYP
jgi:hypothetical protein